MSEEVARTSISLPPDLYDDAKRRMRSLRYRKFSQYVTALIEQDIARRGGHVIERKEVVSADLVQQAAANLSKKKRSGK